MNNKMLLDYVKNMNQILICKRWCVQSHILNQLSTRCQTRSAMKNYRRVKVDDSARDATVFGYGPKLL